MTAHSFPAENGSAVFFNRINTKPAAPAKRGQHYPIADALTHKTKPALTIVQLAETGTQSAFDASVWQHLPPTAWIIRLPPLCDH
jgi:hypothetical protein